MDVLEREDSPSDSSPSTSEEQGSYDVASDDGNPEPTLTQQEDLETVPEEQQSPTERPQQQDGHTPEQGQPTHEKPWEIAVPLVGGKEQILKAQHCDPSLNVLRRNVEESSSQFFYKEGILKRKWMPPHQAEEVEQMVLPQPYRETALRMAHMSTLAGHFGKTKTTLKLMMRFFWPGIRKDVIQMCRACPTCQKTAKRRTPRYPLVPLPILSRPFSRIAMDLVGPLVVSEEGHRYILTVVDYSTRYPEAFPLKETTSTDIARALMEMFSRVGIPEEIITDRGSNLGSCLIEEFYRLFGIEHIKTSAYHPQTDGMVERFNATLKAGLRKYADKSGRKWHQTLPFILFAYRELPHSSTGYTPFELVYMGEIHEDHWTCSKKNGLNRARWTKA